MSSIRDLPRLSDWQFLGSSKYSLDERDEQLAKLESQYYRSRGMADQRGYEFVDPDKDSEERIFLYRMDNNPGGKSSDQETKRTFAFENKFIGIGWGGHVRDNPSSLEEILQDFYEADDPNTKGVGKADTISNESIINFLLWMDIGDVVMTTRHDGHRVFARVRSDVQYTPTSDLTEERKQRFLDLGFWFFRHVDYLGIPRSDVPREFTNRPEMKTVDRLQNITDARARDLITKFDEFTFDDEIAVVNADRVSHQVDYQSLIQRLWALDDEDLIHAIGGGDGLEELVVSYVQRAEDAVVMSKSAPKFQADIEVILQGRNPGDVRPKVIGVQSKSGSLADEDLRGFLNNADLLYVFSDDDFEHEDAINITKSELANYIRTNPTDIPLPIIQSLSKHYV
ncbi:hypothetical protein [Halogeometricum sp. CBA1124]|uniref:hypothetical protein n=1 Tax=Halogeometricum sp. CBA1124 TaxID=2668071 RepID=UPI00142B5B62|nr:hypothetical protein [Halogeometricum sp. CBA1124]MUV56616.1 hypothetical protein [Halogeometricum sp. CBA1124]